MTLMNHETGLKTCPRCEEDLPASSYGKNTRNRDGLTTYCQPCHREKGKAWRAANPERVEVLNRRAQLKHKYGITVEQYDALLDAQGGVCAICENGCRRSLAVDHCHTTGTIRGLLCNSCNLGIGKLGDTVEGLRKALQYLESPLDLPA